MTYQFYNNHPNGTVASPKFNKMAILFSVALLTFTNLNQHKQYKLYNQNAFYINNQNKTDCQGQEN